MAVVAAAEPKADRVDDATAGVEFAAALIFV